MINIIRLFTYSFPQPKIICQTMTQIKAFLSGRLFILIPGKLVVKGKGNPTYLWAMHFLSFFLLSLTHMARRSLMELSLTFWIYLIAQLPLPANIGPSPIVKSFFLAHGGYDSTRECPALKR